MYTYTFFFSAKRERKKCRPREDHSVEFLLVGKKSIKRTKTILLWLTGVIELKDKVPIFLKSPQKWDKIFQVFFVVTIQSKKLFFCSFLRKHELDWLGKCSFAFWVLSLVWFWRKLKCEHHKFQVNILSQDLTFFSLWFWYYHN